jgi:DNA (cytosine-5)-methyltransferase 1
MINKKKQSRPIAVDLFAGVGGMTLGFEQAGFDVLASVEIDPVHCSVHKFNFPFWNILCKSVVDTTGNDIRKLSNIGEQEIDVVFGGPPCQGFSMIGKRFLDDSRNSLVFHYIRLVLELQPKFFIFENVKGITIGKHQNFITEIINQFEKNGYQVCHEYKVLNAAEYGVPQNRQRLFLLGCRHDMQLPSYPLPLTKPATFKLANIDAELPLTPSVWEAIQDLPTIENYPELYEKDWMITDFGKPSDYVKKLCGFFPNDEDFSYKRSYDSGILTSSLRTKHTPESIHRFANTLGGKTEPISRFYKLHPDGICNTLRAGTASNRGAFTSPRPIHPFIPRCITVREAARLHSYPDWFRFHATKWHGFRQIGNSVPPLLAKAIASEIMKVLEIKPDKPNVTHKLGDSQLINFAMSDAAKSFGVERHVIEPRQRKSNLQKKK